MVVAGWFDGVTTEQLTAAATAQLRAGAGFVLQWWGLTEVTSTDRRMVAGLELGDRVTKDTDLENAGAAPDCRDWVVSKAVQACPMPFNDFLALGGEG
ncbi:MAG TPA: hypothetical protein VFR23_01495 [Jiangellaceae bacterium]|nr:hypothetical protein [Jiangellaceae bacterium]